MKMCEEKYVVEDSAKKKPYVKPILKRQAIYSPLYGYLGLGK